MKYIYALLFVMLLIAGGPANAACAGGTCFGIAPGNWSTSGTWSVTSGGASCACTPATGDAIVLNASSGAGTYTIDAAFSIVTLVATGFTGTLTGSSGFALTVSGNTFTLVAGMTYTYTGTITFTSTSGTTAITSAGKQFSSLVFNGVGGTFQIQDAFSVNASVTTTLSNGTFDGNGFAVTLGAFNSSFSNTRTLTLGNGLWTINGTQGWVTTVTTGLTFNKGTSNIVVNNSSGTSPSAFAGGALTYNDVTFAGGGNFTVSGSFTVANIFITSAARVQVAQSSTVTISNAFTWSGASSGAGMLLFSSIAGTRANISVASGASSMTWVAIEDMNFTGGGTFAATNSMDIINNAGITITPPSGGGSSSHIIGTPFKSPQPCIEWTEPRTKPAANDNACIEAQAA